METLVNNLFDNVKNKDVECPIYNDHPYGSEQLKRKFYVVPVKDIRSLKISFSAPDVIDQYRTSVCDYLLNKKREFVIELNENVSSLNTMSAI